MQSYSLNTNNLMIVEDQQVKKEKNVSKKIAKSFISRIEANYSFKTLQVKKIVFSLALAVSAASEAKICLKCFRRSLLGDKDPCPEKVIVQKFIKNLRIRSNFSEEEVENVVNELFNSINYTKVIHSFELIQSMRTFMKSSATV